MLDTTSALKIVLPFTIGVGASCYAYYMYTKYTKKQKDEMLDEIKSELKHLSNILHVNIDRIPEKFEAYISNTKLFGNNIDDTSNLELNDDMKIHKCKTCNDMDKIDDKGFESDDEHDPNMSVIHSNKEFPSLNNKI